MSLGLTRQRAEELRRECGSNVITTHRVTAFDVLRRQVDNPLLLLLVVAALLSTLTGQPADGVIIGLILALSIGLGFTNEYRSERHMAALHMRIQHTAVVWRDGDPIELPAHELVPGDVVELKIGSLVPADGDVLESRDLEIDESMLTGESLAVGKSSSSNAGGWDDTNRVLMGSIVQRGSGRFRVTSIGGATQFGGVVRSLGERAPVTRFQSGLSEFSGLLSKFAGILIVVTFIVNLAFHRPVIEASLFCLSIAIGITPQLLPAIVSLSLSVGAHHLAARKVLVKRLVTIEDLGNINVLFTDKTGTITEGRIAFDRAVPIDDSSDCEILRLGLLCNEAIGVAEGKPEGATLDVATWLAPNASIELLKGATVIDVVPFDHVRRMTSVVARDPDGTTFVIVKGAPEAVLSRCAEVSSADRASLDKLFADGMRVVAIATQATTSDKVTQEAEAGLSLRGYLTFFDRPRTDAGVAVHRLAELGVRVKIITGDNGASAEGTVNGAWSAPSFQNGYPEDPEWLLDHIDDFGSAKCENHFNLAWAWALDSPFQWMKQIASHFGGTRNAVAVQWPKAIADRGGLRNQFHHVTDIFPTLLEAAGIEPPAAVNGIEQLDIDGVSMLSTFASSSAPETHLTQYFEMFGNRAIYNDGWIASCFHGRVPWKRFDTVPFDGPQEKWELYDIRNDFSQGHDLADRHPEKLAEMLALFDAEARRNNVYPLKEPGSTFGPKYATPTSLGNLTKMTYTIEHQRMPERSVVNLKNCSFRITAEVTVHPAGCEGVVVCQGGNMAGWSLYVDATGRPVFHYNWFGHEHFVAMAPSPLSGGRHVIVVDFAYDGGFGAGGEAVLSVDGAAAAYVRVEKTVPVIFSISGETFDVGLDTGAAVGPYPHVYRFTGAIHGVTLERLSEPSAEVKALLEDAEFRASLAVQ